MTAGASGSLKSHGGAIAAALIANALLACTRVEASPERATTPSPSSAAASASPDASTGNDGGDPKAPQRAAEKPVKPDAGAKTFPCGTGKAVCNEDEICCQGGSHSPACFTGPRIPDWCMLPVALRGACDQRTNRPCAPNETCCLQLHPVGGAANPVCLDQKDADDCAK